MCMVLTLPAVERAMITQSQLTMMNAGLAAFSPKKNLNFDSLFLHFGVRNGLNDIQLFMSDMNSYRTLRRLKQFSLEGVS